MIEIDRNPEITDEVGNSPVVIREGMGEKRDYRSFLRVGLKDLSEADLSTDAARRFLIFEISVSMTQSKS